MAFPELVTPGGIQVDGPAKGDLGRLFNAVVSVHGYKDGELDSVGDGEIAAAWMETAHAMAPPLEFQVRFVNPASMAREFIHHSTVGTLSFSHPLFGVSVFFIYLLSDASCVRPAWLFQKRKSSSPAARCGVSRKNSTRKKL